MDDFVRRLPAPSVLLRASQALALLDAIMCDEEMHRYYRFDPNWGEGLQLASMSSGSGDEYAIVFGAETAFVRGFDHESDLSPFTRDPVEVHPGVLDGLPTNFQSLVDEPAFRFGGVLMVSMACWWERGGPWRFGSPPPELTDGSDWLFDLVLEGTPEAYAEFAREYYEIDVESSVVNAVFTREPISLEQARKLNAELTADRFKADVERIGYLN